MAGHIHWLAFLALLAPTRGQISTLDPCKPANHKEINEPHRSTAYKSGYPEVPLCDMHLPPAWYRFNSAAGSQMPTTCPDRLSCGTVVPIWLKGTHPRVQDGVVMRTACGNFETGAPGDTPCCEHSISVAVKNCGDFYVYYLRPTPSCPVAYCAGDKLTCPVGQWSPTGLPPCKDAFPPLTTPPTMTDPIINNKSFSFECQINFPTQDPDQRFEVVWTFDGKEDPAVPKQVLSDPSRTATLDGALLKGHLNSNVGCHVRAFYKDNEVNKSPPLKSNTFFAGIMIDPAQVGVSEEEYDKNVTITSTIPILCDHDLECCLVFKLQTSGARDQMSVQSMCDYKLCTEHWDPVAQTASVQVPVLANRDLLRDGRSRTMLSFEELLPAGGGDYLETFSGVTASALPVEVMDGPPSSCTLTGDPHIRGFDSNQRFHLFKTGDFTVFDVPSRQFQVQIRTWPCGRNRHVSCICGVSIRERNDVIRINQCDQRYGGRHTSPTVDIANQLSPGTIVKRSRSGSHIGTLLASGSEVRVDARNTGMNLFITTPGIDLKEARGLCGTNDGNSHNEFTHPDGTADPGCRPGDRLCIPDSFEESWRVAHRRSLFTTVPQPMNHTQDVKYCQCQNSHSGGPAADCSYREHVVDRAIACQGCQEITDTLVPDFLTQGGGWTKRSATFADIDIPDSPYVLQQLPDVSPNATWPNAEGLTEIQAEDMCKKALHSSPLWHVCGNMQDMGDNLVGDCMADILFGGTTDFIPMVVEAFTVECQQNLAQDPANYVTDPSGKRVMKPEYVDDICPPECDEHGQCSAHGGQCVCDQGWEGEMCHIETGKGPQMDNIRSGSTCDLMQRPCRRIFVDVSNIDLSDHLICRIQPVNDQGTNMGPAMDTQAVFLSAKRIACDLPKTASSSQHYMVSASNDGTVFGSELPLLVFDSTCLDCDAGGCTQKPLTCNIGGKCYRNGAKSAGDDSKICDVAKSTTDWTVFASLNFLPTMTGPDTDFLMGCEFSPLRDAKGDITVTWSIDGASLATEVLTGGVTKAYFSTTNLPASGKLMCTVSLNGAKADSQAIDVSTIRRS